MKRADRLHAALALILGDDELAQGVVTAKDMKTGEQVRVARAEVVEYCGARVARVRE